MHAQNIPALRHYLDDFITAGPPDSPQCAHNLAITLAVCKRLGLPLHPGKCEGPATVLVVLGIELDSVSQIACLPSEKLSALQDLISSWLPRKSCNRCDLESLICHLHHAAKVVWPGRTFLRRRSTSRAASARRIIQFASIGSFTWICFGGTSFYRTGMELASGFSQACSLKPMWKFPQMLPVHWDMEHS